ncbi:MAG: hypothetical protein GF355_13395 [Candidatus Eisenbacteria bacterium]|nr:hypothetical protein [Candidatus Eisenbacteria bacterium]
MLRLRNNGEAMRRRQLMAGAMAGALIVAGGSAGCVVEIGETVEGSGSVKQVERSAAGFHGVALSAACDVIVEQGEEEGVSIRGEENLLEYIETGVEDCVLRVGSRRGFNLRPTKPLIVAVSLKELDRLQISGSGTLEAANLNVVDLSIRVSGSGDAELLNLCADELTVRISGSGDVTTAGYSTFQDVAISGSGEYEAHGLESDIASVEITGSGSAAVNVNEELSVRITGSGDVAYGGRPEVKRRITGSGALRRLED